MEQQEQNATPEAAEEYAIVELMGHVRHVGRLTEVERFGTKMGRIDIPKDGDFANGFTTVFFSGGSIYRITPCDLATVHSANKPYAPASRLTYRAPEPDPGLGGPEGSDDDHDFENEPSF